MDPPHAVAVAFAEHGDAARRRQHLHRIVRDQHPARHAVRQAMAEDEKRPSRLLLGDQPLNLRQNLRLPGRHIRRFLAKLILDIWKPHAVEIRFGDGAGDGGRLDQSGNGTSDRERLCQFGKHAAIQLHFARDLSHLLLRLSMKAKFIE
jgi:hypothetical protein